MRKKTVIFRKVEDMLDFIKKVECYPFDMDMKSGRFTVDAKSLFGLLNLGQIGRASCRERVSTTV